MITPFLVSTDNADMQAGSDHHGQTFLLTTAVISPSIKYED